jgi:hypothetical protein
MAFHSGAARAGPARRCAGVLAVARRRSRSILRLESRTRCRPWGSLVLTGFLGARVARARGVGAPRPFTRRTRGGRPLAASTWRRRESRSVMRRRRRRRASDAAACGWSDEPASTPAPSSWSLAVRWDSRATPRSAAQGRSARGDRRVESRRPGGPRCRVAPGSIQAKPDARPASAITLPEASEELRRWS